jgi:lipoyl(octanoyl) transferase
MANAPPELWVVALGEIEYREALALQERIRDARQAGAVPDTMLLLEHPPVYTRGRRSGAGELSMGEAWYRERGIEIIEVNRGGRVTYHGPGQLIGYPIVAVDDVVQYVRTLERGLVAALAREGVAARARVDDGPDYTGVWVAERKIASIGVHVARGVTTHGFAVNVVNDLAPFSWVVACGLPDVSMTSLAAEAPSDAPDRERLRGFETRTALSIAEALGRRQRIVSRARLEHALAGGSVTA